MKCFLNTKLLSASSSQSLDWVRVSNVIFIISWYFFRAFIWGALAVIPLSCAVILNFGLMGLFGIKLSHITAILTAIIIGVGVDFAIHYISEFKRNLNKKIPLDRISKHNVDDVGYPSVDGENVITVSSSCC